MSWNVSESHLGSQSTCLRAAYKRYASFLRASSFTLESQPCEVRLLKHCDWQLKTRTSMKVKSVNQTKIKRLWYDHLCQSVSSVAGLLFRMLFFNHVPTRGHSAVEQGLLHILLFGGQQVPEDWHQLCVFYQRHISVYAKRQVSLNRKQVLDAVRSVIILYNFFKHFSLLLIGSIALVRYKNIL